MGQSFTLGAQHHRGRVQMNTMAAKYRRGILVQKEGEQPPKLLNLEALSTMVGWGQGPQ